MKSQSKDNLDSTYYKNKLALEKSRYRRKRVQSKGPIGTILTSPVFFTPQRNIFNYIFPKEQMIGLLRFNVKGKKEKLLVAPCGNGDDFVFVKDLANEIHGIDISQEALKSCPKQMKVKAADILNSGYEDESFDLIVCPLFFHHFVDIGFTLFLSEFYRILKKGGSIVILEPSVLYFTNLITRPIKKIFNNPMNEVGNEAPFLPQKMSGALKDNGFIDVQTQAATFSHCTFFVPLAKLVNFLTRPLLNLRFIKYFAWMVVFYGKKPE